MALAHELVAHILPVDRHATERASILIIALAKQLRRLLEDDTQAISGSDTRRWVAMVAPWATGKLRRIHGAALCDKADA
jgi:hypothetical protein